MQLTCIWALRTVSFVRWHAIMLRGALIAATPTALLHQSGRRGGNSIRVNRYEPLAKPACMQMSSPRLPFLQRRLTWVSSLRVRI